jgi:peptidoglycan hydrolase CwlO-like protein
MNCPHCNSIIADESVFCRYCGNKIDRAAVMEKEKKNAEKEIRYLQDELSSCELIRRQKSEKLDSRRSSNNVFKFVVLGITLAAVITAVCFGYKTAQGPLESDALIGLLISGAVAVGCVIGFLLAMVPRSKEIERLEGEVADQENMIKEIKAKLKALQNNMGSKEGAGR